MDATQNLTTYDLGALELRRKELGLNYTSLVAKIKTAHPGLKMSYSTVRNLLSPMSHKTRNRQGLFFRNPQNVVVISEALGFETVPTKEIPISQ